MSRAQDHVPVKLYATDCEGPISKNDNAYELCERFLPEGAAFFERVSRYDDYLADVVRKPGYRPGDTLRLILPFLRAYGVSDGPCVVRWTSRRIEPTAPRSPSTDTR